MREVAVSEDQKPIYESPVQFDWELVLAQLPMSMALQPDDIHRKRVVNDLLGYLRGERARPERAEAKLHAVLGSLVSEA
jgi:hypothetical protein